MLRQRPKLAISKGHTLIKPSANRISTSSLRTGKRPPWWMPMPRRKNGTSEIICGSFLSSGERDSMALLTIKSTAAFSLAKTNQKSKYSKTKSGSGSQNRNYYNLK